MYDNLFNERHILSSGPSQVFIIQMFRFIWFYTFLIINYNYTLKISFLYVVEEKNFLLKFKLKFKFLYIF